MLNSTEMGSRNYENIRGKISLGLCCINTVLRKQKVPVFCSRTVIRKNFTVVKAKALALQNVKDICQLIQWNEDHQIRCLRLSSDIFPHFTDLETSRYTIDFAHDDLKKAGDLAKKYKHRIVMHPAQFNQVGANTAKVLSATIKDLTHHADILDAMGIDHNGVLIVHGGGIYKSKIRKNKGESLADFQQRERDQAARDKDVTIARWISQFKTLPSNVQQRLVIEHCERCYNIRDCLKIAEGCHIPLVFDNHHYECYNTLYPNDSISEKELLDELFPRIIKTWKGRKMLCHISEQGEGRVGHHSDYIQSVPDYFFGIVEKYHIEFDLEVEAKMKEQAILALYRAYPDVFTVFEI